MKKGFNKPCKIIEGCRIFGNGHNIPLIYGFELTDKEKKDFDYLDNVEDSFTGFRYRGNVYSLDEFMRTDKNSPFSGTFHGIRPDSILFQDKRRKQNEQNNRNNSQQRFHR